MMIRTNLTWASSFLNLRTASLII